MSITAQEYAKARLSEEAEKAAAAASSASAAIPGLFETAKYESALDIPYIKPIVDFFTAEKGESPLKYLAKSADDIEGTVLTVASDLRSAGASAESKQPLSALDPRLAELLAQEGITGEPTVADLELWLTTCKTSSLCTSERRYEIAARYVRLLANSQRADALAIKEGASSDSALGKALAGGDIGAFASEEDVDRIMLKLIEEVETGVRSPASAFSATIAAMSASKSDIVAYLKRRYSSELAYWSFAPADLPEKVEGEEPSASDVSEAETLMDKLEQMGPVSKAGPLIIGLLVAAATATSKLPDAQAAPLWARYKQWLQTIAAAGGLSENAQWTFLQRLSAISSIPQDIKTYISTLLRSFGAQEVRTSVRNTATAPSGNGLAASYREASEYITGKADDRADIHVLTLTLATQITNLQ